uniref:Uncharacterized protein n=1 Tax=Cercocebus atys TaxID=9531 RepID=A0A2K5MDA4_CERAT
MPAPQAHLGQHRSLPLRKTIKIKKKKFNSKTLGQDSKLSSELPLEKGRKVGIMAKLFRSIPLISLHCLSSEHCTQTSYKAIL